jgi:DNA excision repair protein ERCC-3
MMEKYEEIFSIIGELKKKYEDFIDALEKAIEMKNVLEKSFSDILEDLLSKLGFSDIDKDLLKEFLRKPYVILPKGRDQWYVIAPRWIDFQLGWLERQTEGYNIFVIDRYTKWFTGFIPPELEKHFKYKHFPVRVVNGILETTEEYRDVIWDHYRKHFSHRIDEKTIKVKRGHEFELIASLIEDGILPFTPKPVSEEDLRDPVLREKIVLREYQRDALNYFLKYGAIGIFWPFGTGKSLFGIYLLSIIKGYKLVVVPTVTLKEQWLNRVKQYILEDYWKEIVVETYASFHKVRDKEWVLIIFDECHHLPANTYIRLSTLRTRYRVGLSGTPYREDGRENYVIALTGYPLGLDWRYFKELGIVKLPRVVVYILPNRRAKIEKLKDILRSSGKTVVFCDSLDFGHNLAKKFGLQFIYGETTNRIEKIEENEKIIISRVGDEGISLPELDTVIEVDFLYGSRRQELQRVGRLLHAKNIGQHIILMTMDEFNKYHKRLLSLYEKGFKIEIIR